MRVRGFDGLRALAVLWVIFWHTLIRTGLPPENLGAVRLLVTSGWAGVDLFFALSGFLITSLLLREEQTFGVFGLWRFYARRAGRILPPFFLVLALNVLVLSRLPLFVSVHHVGGWQLFAFATFWGNYHHAYVQAVEAGAAFGIYWSLCVEEHFYIFWPVVLRALRSSGAARIGFAATVCLAILALRWHTALERDQTEWSVHSLSHLRVDSILWGALAALTFDALRARPRLRRSALAFSLAGAAWLVARGDLVFPGTSALGAGIGLTTLAVGFALLVAEVAAAQTSWLVRALEARPLRAIGQVSYGMYLLQFQAIDLGERVVFAVPRAPTLGQLLITGTFFSVLAFGLAALMYAALERPLAALRSRLAFRSAQSGAIVHPTDS